MSVKLTCIRIEEVLLDRTGITAEQLRTKSRKREIVYARHILFWIAYYFKINGNYWSTIKIGQYYSGKDHATVLHSKKAVNNFIQTDREFRQLVYNVLNDLNLKTGIVDKIAKGKTKKLTRLWIKHSR